MPCVFVGYNKSASTPSTKELSGGTSTCLGMPFYGLYDYSQGGAIYLASDLTELAGKTITAIAYDWDGWNIVYEANNQVIKLGHISGSNFPYTASPTYSDVNGGVIPTLTTCKSGFSTLDFNPNTLVGGFIKNEFTTNFVYNGTSNLLISWENYDGTWRSNYGHIDGFTPDPSVKRYATWYDDNVYPTASSSSGGNRVPNIIFYYQ
jgi:hypothetical protein